MCFRLSSGRSAAAVLWLFALPSPAQLMGGPNKIIRTLQGITFDSAYDNGSLQNVVSVGTDVFNGTLYTESGAQGTAKYWFRFRLSGIAGRTFRLNLDHVENPRPYIRIAEGAWRRTTAAEAPSTSALHLTFSQSEDTAELAFFEPLGFNEIRQAVAERISASAFAGQTLIGATTEIRPVEMVTVEDPWYPSAGKHRIWVHSRVHAGEVTASHSMLGFLDRILAGDELGRRLREHCIFTIVPMVNADGIARGHTRWDSTGADPEREWCDIRLPEVQALKTRVDAFMAGPDPVEVALNLHSTKGNFADSFFFKHLAPSVSPAFVTIQQNYIDAVAAQTPLFNNASPRTSQLNACLFIESYFWNNWGSSVMALTHEGHYYRRQTDGDWITGADYREIGAALAGSLTTYFPLPPVSEPGLTWDSWRALHFSPADLSVAAVSGPDADPDKDGTVNLFEYALGRDPLIPDGDPAPVRAVLSADFPAALNLETEISSYPTDLDFFYESSPDLTTWTRVISTPGGPPASSFSGRRADGQAVEQRRLRFTPEAGSAPIFHRFAVRKLP